MRNTVAVAALSACILAVPGASAKERPADWEVSAGPMVGWDASEHLHYGGELALTRFGYGLPLILGVGGEVKPADSTSYLYGEIGTNLFKHTYVPFTLMVGAGGRLGENPGLAGHLFVGLPIPVRDGYHNTWITFAEPYVRLVFGDDTTVVYGLSLRLGLCHSKCRWDRLVPKQIFKW